MWFVVALVFPLLLLGLLAGMERVERPLRQDDVTVRLRSSLDSARPEELESLVSQGFGPALDRYWRRRSRRNWPAALRRSFRTAPERSDRRTTESRA
jgi:hypothetical protein